MQRYDPETPKPLPQYSQNTYYSYWEMINHQMPMTKNAEAFGGSTHGRLPEWRSQLGAREYREDERYTR